MEKIHHNYVNVRGLKLHFAEIGTGPVVVFLHGFPEIWYSWRHQMIAVADAGFRVIAPDFRGYGLSELPTYPKLTTFKDLVDDLLDMIDSLDIHKVFLVGKDFGARVVFHFALLHPNRVLALATLGVPFLLTGPGTFPQDLLPKGFYVLRWQEPGRAEADFGRFDTKTVVKNIYILFSGSELPAAKDDEEIMDLVDPSTPLPAWAWLEEYGVEDIKIKVPSLLVMGEKDYALKFGGFEHFISSGMVKEYVPNLEITFLPEGSHFVQEQFPQQVNQLIINFLNKLISRK
ncbi:hypothetical protein KY289_006826 [Solanum tuberosum]|nr:hypothetical protein KY289_006826 [Solanum tuberosum]